MRNIYFFIQIFYLYFL